jgi:type I restriction enzyme S subunit
MTNYKNVPALRFKGFEGEWETVKFGDIFSFKRTNSFSRSLLNYENGTVKNIHYGDIHTKFNTNFDITKENVPFINEDISFKNITEDDYVKVGDLVIADASEDYKDIGKAIEIRNVDNQKLISGLHTYIARDEANRMALGFNGYFMKTQNMRFQIMRIATGVSVLGVSKTNLVKLEFPIPTKPEQQKIANFLTATDTKIQQLRQKKELLNDYKKGVMQQIFKQEIRFKNDDGGDFEDWEVKKLGEVLISRNEKTLKSNQHEILSSTTRGLFLQSEYFTRDIASKDNTGYKILRKNQLVFSPQNIWMGNININRKYEIGIVSPSYKIFSFSNDVCVLFLNDFLKIPKMIHEYAQVSEQGASIVRRNLNVELFLDIKVKLPQLEEQQKIANFLTSIDERIGKVSDEIGEMERYKKGLLQGMFV